MKMFEREKSNGNYNEMLIVAKNSPLLSSFVIKKTSQLLNIIR